MKGGFLMIIGKDICLIYEVNKQAVSILKGVSFEITGGKVTALIGKSGARKHHCCAVLLDLKQHLMAYLSLMDAICVCSLLKNVHV